MLLYPLVVILLADLSTCVCKSVRPLVCKSAFCVCLLFFALTNMNNPNCFFQLRKLQEKALRYTFHQDNYNFFSVSRLIPTGLQISHTPQIGKLSPNLQKKWNQILYSASIQLIKVLSEQCEITLQAVHQDIANLDSKLRASCSESQYKDLSDEIEKGLSNLNSVLTDRRNKKIGGLVAKQRRHNRFRRSPQSTPLPPTNTVVNLSSSSLTDAEHTLLSKGLNFCPTPPKVDQVMLSQDLTEYYRRLRLTEFFFDSGSSKEEPFRVKSTWVPPKNRVPALETYVQAVSSQVSNSSHLTRKPHDNLPREERLALNTLRSRGDIIIKPADKGSAVVIMDRQKYIDEANRQLNNPQHYKCLDSNPTGKFSEQIQEVLDDMRSRDHLSKKAHRFLSPINCRTARFYLLPKIHKANNPGRPIISGNGSPTEHISLFIDSFLKPLVPQIPSYVHDTPDFLRKLESVKDQIPATAIIGTIDVSSLYTNIPQEEGIQACSSALAKGKQSSPPISDITTLMRLVLAKNNFSFLGKHYLQVHGTAMGTRMAPSFACLFMGDLEERMLSEAPCRPWIWWRYIDDVFFIWTRDGSSLNAFFDHINSFHRTIKFTWEQSLQQTHFLDVTVRKDLNTLTTDLYSKPTDTHQYLHSSSCHPRHCKTGIAYSQALRLRRICSNESDFRRHTRVLASNLVARGYSSRQVKNSIAKVYSIPRSSALKQKPPGPKDKPKVPLVTSYHPSLPPLRKITKENHHILHTSDRLAEAIPNSPVLAFRRPRNLRDLIVRAEVPPLDSSPPTKFGTFKCTSKCIVCKTHVKEIDSFNGHSSGTTHTTYGSITCTTSNIIYLISCRVCNIQYVGETKNTLKKRIYGHRSTIKTGKMDTPVGYHFNLPDHSISDMSVLGIESLGHRNNAVRLSREKMWMKRLRTIQPHGLNIQEGND